jgi:hypothetical protein
MSDRMTSITVLGARGMAGVADYGMQTPEAMVRQIRAWADHMRAQVAAIDQTADDDFHIETYVGVLARRNLKILQQGTDRNPRLSITREPQEG